MCRERNGFREFLSEEVKFLLKLVAHILTSILLAIGAILISGHKPDKPDNPAPQCSKPKQEPVKTTPKTGRK